MIAATACFASVGTSHAAGTSHANDAACRFAPAGKAVVAGVIDGRSFRATDGSEIRLEGIEVPLMPRAGETPSSAALAAKVALERLIAGRELELTALARHADRYGRIMSYPVIAGEALPVQHALIALGMAQASARIDNRACRDALLLQENGARRAKLGLWADPVYALRDASRPATILPVRGRYAVIEGKVLSVRGSGGTIYMNFGRRWTEGFAVTIRKRDERLFAAAGLTPKSLEGRVVRVRGWIAERGGPRIEAALPEQIEIAEGN